MLEFERVIWICRQPRYMKRDDFYPLYLFYFIIAPNRLRICQLFFPQKHSL